ncbi:thiamine pyrophosphate-binding protein [Staphylococcus gallinarum]|uniref:thiamine pyrophosphate-binding protein n=1 Tax=Staphylococcus gallinarum TaxID=1293 RepID=UPI000D1DEF59|nr:thiamine pyrophosphate-binding protein [Staphylococcus gallinarum]PTK91973.1 hypothetical protein BUZ13_08550 [Staphylococcus gallinarum]PTK94147.1 hypothetical protein BUZ05_05585 [Staphylococcus gallinarum]RIO87167.1 hypothetical protein BUZ06_12035 [Staphylococcus gallinarum]
MSNTSEHILYTLVNNGYTYFTGVPCSLLKGIFSELENNSSKYNNLHFYPSIREDSALGLASGFTLSGNKSVVLMQNSGLGYSLNVLTSFNLIYDIPLLLIVSWRGYSKDAVEHDVMGKKTLDLLDSVDIPYQLLDTNNVEESINLAESKINSSNKPVALIVKDKV